MLDYKFWSETFALNRNKVSKNIKLSLFVKLSATAVECIILGQRGRLNAKGDLKAEF